MIARLTESLDFHSQALMLRAERQRLIASNIANADTPGYQARDFDFATALRAATGNGGGIAADVMQPGGRPNTALRYVVPTQTNLDSNTVDMDRERSAIAQNAIMYQFSINSLDDEWKEFKMASSDPRR